MNQKLLKKYAHLLVKTGLDVQPGQKVIIESPVETYAFARMVSALGGPKDFVEKYDKYLPQAQLIKPVFALKSGYVSAEKTREIGLSLIGLKGGRTHPEQKLDFATGFSDFCTIGDYVDDQTPLAFVHAQNEEDFALAAEQIRQAVTISEQKPDVNDVIIEYIR